MAISDWGSSTSSTASSYSYSYYSNPFQIKFDDIPGEERKSIDEPPKPKKKSVKLLSFDPKELDI